MIFLLDLNLLLALAWPSHVHHEPAHAWFEREAASGWATCPLTQLGFVRLSSNTAFSSDAVSPTTALSLLQDITDMDGHEFWSDDVDCVSVPFSRDVQLTGHRQVTDAYLLLLARARSGCLATLDRRVGWLVPRHLRPNPHLRIVEAH
ncbi:MAG: VapC toxin family PIN domain ribonuclease [bacterium]|nr:VapC toxin family PIN domain ribonuclease [bacterium]MDE0241259.1 VapC toxin family PIN domain ribonuclease [bacterium]MDE0416458.1 VapC toxin family PIN domain ribonuclease [bacterium]